MLSVIFPFWHPAAAGHALPQFVPSERPTPELRDVRFNRGKQECAPGARQDRRSAWIAWKAHHLRVARRRGDPTNLDSAAALKR
jgi:hypothetical protein